MGGSTEFQSPDGDFVYSDQIAEYSVVGVRSKSFNPLTGISSILTDALGGVSMKATTRFNPLTGISSILTITAFAN